MLPTFVIGLREGLEAALIVSIIATFLRRNSASTRAMWLGVGAGIVLSVLVGVVLRVVEQSLPQSRQEKMETVIGLVAVVFVTGMIMWMHDHARYLKRDLEAHAALALKSATTTALAVMAFLAVLREGFETSVFLLATFSSASSAPAAMIGAVLGILVAVGLGWGIYKGGVRLNLQRFFSITSVFLVLVAAGLVLNAMRTGHEAGWITIGQGETVDLSWLAPAGSVRSALVSGVLGIPRDPRWVELVAWLAYLVPVSMYAFWPNRLRPAARAASRMRIAGIAAALLGAFVLALAVRTPAPHVAVTAPVEGGGTVTFDAGRHTATLTKGDHVVALTESGTDTWTATGTAGSLPSTLDVTALLALNGQRIPVGLDIHTSPGPYDVAWDDNTKAEVVSSHGGIVDGGVTGKLVMTLSGGGISVPRVIVVDEANWRVDPSYVAATRATLATQRASAADHALWNRWVPIGLLVVAVVLTLDVARRRRRVNADAPTQFLISTSK